MKYITIKTAGIITQIGHQLEVKDNPGMGRYTKGIIEVFLPDDDEVDEMGKKGEKEWIRANNRRMRAICKFLNENKL